MSKDDRRRLGSAVSSIPKWAAYAVIAWQARLSIEALAGKNGLASLLTRFGRQTSYWELVCWAAGLLGMLYGLYNHHLLRRQMTKDAFRMEAIEKQIATLSGTTALAGSSARRADVD